jgi:hypothetical protein
MSRRTVSLALAAALAIPAFAGPARANSITTYGVIITAMGNELQVQYVDKPTGESGGSSGVTCPVGDSGGKGDGLLVTPDGSGGINVTPYNGGSVATPPGKGATGVDDSVPQSIGDVGGTTGENGGTVPKIDFTDPSSPDGKPGDTTVDDPAGPIQTVTGGPTSAANTPEPASMTLLALAGVGGWLARRRRTR